MQNLIIGLERQDPETEEQMRQLEEQKTLEIFKLENEIGDEDEFHPENLEKLVVPDMGDFLGNISDCDDEQYLRENRKLIQTQLDDQQNAKVVATSSQQKYRNR